MAMEIDFTAYDVGLRDVGCACYYTLEFEGQLQQQQLAHGLQR